MNVVGISQKDLDVLIQELDTEFGKNYKFYDKPFDSKIIMKEFPCQIPKALCFKHGETIETFRGREVHKGFKCRVWNDDGVCIIGIIESYRGIGGFV